MHARSRPRHHWLAHLEAQRALDGAAEPSGQCARMLLRATASALTRSTVSIVFCKRERYVWGDYAEHVAAELRGLLPGLLVHVTPLYDMQPDEEGCPGSFEVGLAALEPSRPCPRRLATAGRRRMRPAH